MSRQYSTCIPPVSHLILDISLCPYIYIHLAILQQIHCIPLYPTVSSCIRTYLAVSSCIPLYLTVSHRLENGIWPKIHSRGGSTMCCPDPSLLRVRLYKILFHLKALWWRYPPFIAPPHLQRLPYCNTIARPLRNIGPATDPPFVCHTPYNIGDGNIV